MKKLAIISGASKGIGKATAKRFIDENWQVINLSRSLCDIPNVVNYKIDLADPNLKDSLPDLLAATLKNSDQICLVHNACAYHPGAVGEACLDGLNHSWQVNILAPVILNQLVIPYMKNNSSILYVGSTLSEMAVPNCMPYVVSKHAMIGLMRSTCQDVSGKGIHTSCICPGFTATETLLTHLNAGNRNVSDITDKVMMKRLIQPDEIANFIFYGANQPIVNGSVMHVNLGSINN